MSPAGSIQEGHRTYKSRFRGEAISHCVRVEKTQVSGSAASFPVCRSLQKRAEYGNEPVNVQNPPPASAIPPKHPKDRTSRRSRRSFSALLPDGDKPAPRNPLTVPSSLFPNELRERCSIALSKSGFRPISISSTTRLNPRIAVPNDTYQNKHPDADEQLSPLPISKLPFGSRAFRLLIERARFQKIARSPPSFPKNNRAPAPVQDGFPVRFDREFHREPAPFRSSSIPSPKLRPSTESIPYMNRERC